MRRRRVRVTVVIAVAACGRIGFNTHERDAGGGSDSGACTWSAFSTPVRIPGMANAQNTDEWAAAPTLGGTQLFFHSYRAPNSDLYVSTKAGNGDWSAATRIAELDNGVDQWTPTLTEDGMLLVYSDESSGNYKLWSARRDSPMGMWNNAAPLPVVNTGGAAQDNHPFLSADGLRLAFMSSRMGPDFIFETTRMDRVSSFASPIQLGLGSGDATNPTLSDDGLELFFVSKRGGGADVYTARRPAIGQPFDAPVKVNTLSSARDECCLRLSKDGTTMYLDFDTLTAGGGSADIYTATRSCQ